MARLAKFTESILYVDSTGYLKPAAGATVTVYDVDTVNAKTIYSSAAGASQTNPLPVLGADGLLEFYVDSDDRRFDLYIEPTASAEFTAYTLEDMQASVDPVTFYSSEYATLQAAVDAMSDGDTLVIDTSHTITATTGSLTLNDKDNITIDGGARGFTDISTAPGHTIIAGANLNSDIITIYNSDRVTIKNLSINGNSTNQGGAGPYYGITFASGSGCSSVSLVDVYITDVKGDGLRYDNTTDLNCTRVECSSNLGYGFVHLTAGDAVRPHFTDCTAATNGSDNTLARRHGYYACPLPEHAAFTSCRAATNAGSGWNFSSNATANTVDGLHLIGCQAVGNGTVAGTYYGLHCYIANASNILYGLVVAGGTFTDSDDSGICLETDASGNGSIIGYSITGVSCMDNGDDGVEIVGEVGYGSVSGGSFYSNGGTGVSIAGAASCYADYNSVTGNACHANTTYGVSLGTNARYTSVFANACSNNGSNAYIDSGGTDNTIFGATENTGFLGMPHKTGHGGSADNDGYWLEVTSVFTTAGGGVTASGNFKCDRVTTNTRVISLVPADLSAATFMCTGTTGQMWYHKPSENSAGSHIIIRFTGKADEHQQGTWNMLLMEPLDLA